MKLVQGLFGLYRTAIIIIFVSAIPRFWQSGAAFRPATLRRPNLLAAESQRLEFYSEKPESSATTDDLTRWEQMYQEGEAMKQKSNEGTSMQLLSRSEIRVVSLDLDNTLWNTSAVIGGANDALAAFLDTEQIKQPKRVEKLMGDLFKANRTKYSPLSPDSTGPVRLTELRTDALQHLLQEFNGYSSEDAVAFAQRAFDVWTEARHQAIPQHFAESALTCLDRVASIKTSTGHGVLIGAITDGNSDPRKVDVLSDYFDFVINAEGVGVGKPDKRVYVEALRYVASHPNFRDLNASDKSEEGLEDIVGPYWVHVGDDFVKDIVAGKSLKMRTVWSTEFVKDTQKDATIEKVAAEESNGPRTIDNFVKEVSEKSVVRMSIGDDSYLAETMIEEFVDAKVEKFEQIAEILLSWHEEGTQMAQEAILMAVETEPRDRSQIENVGSRKYPGEILTVITPDMVEMEPLRVLQDSTAPLRVSRAFRIVRDDCSMDIPAPRDNSENRTMKEIMTLAQTDKTSGVFAFPADQVVALQDGKTDLMVKIGGTDLQFSRMIFADLSVDYVLSLSDDNPVVISLHLKKVAGKQSFDFF